MSLDLKYIPPAINKFSAVNLGQVVYLFLLWKKTSEHKINNNVNVHHINKIGNHGNCRWTPKYFDIDARSLDFYISAVNMYMHTR